jgi:hypothetical protein
LAEVGTSSVEVVEKFCKRLEMFGKSGLLLKIRKELSIRGSAQLIVDWPGTGDPCSCS